MTERPQPLAIDLFAGLGGWTSGLLAEGYYVIGFDTERHVYGEHRYPAQLVLQDVTTLHGSQFKDATLIVASPPCQAYSYRAMPWKRAKALPPPDNTLFDPCFRIQREASEAAGWHIPLVVENVRGAIPWVGRSRWNFGSFHLWGDVPALMPTVAAIKNTGGSWFAIGGPGQKVTGQNPDGRKVPGVQSWSDYGKPGYKPTAFNGQAKRNLREGVKHDGSGWRENKTIASSNRMVQGPKGSKFASAMIAKIPLPLSTWIARTYHPKTKETLP